MKELTVFANGDSSKISTWSNVPFFFTETLLSKGIKINRVDLSPHPFLQRIYNNVYVRLLKIIFKNTSYNYFRSYIHFVHVRLRIKKAIKTNLKSEAFIFLTFSFSSGGLTKKPTIQFCDWTYEHYINYFLNRKPDFLEKLSIAREDTQIVGSDILLPLFPIVAEYMEKKFQDNNIYYLGNVINSFFKPVKNEILELKRMSNKLLFVGSIKYMDGAVSLIEAFEIVKKKCPALTLHIIGIDRSAFKYLPDDVFCYGYLDKSIHAERELYYNLFKEAKIFINTTPKWASFSASIEAMYYYTPVVISPSDEFIKTFGEEIKFGAYCKNNSSYLIVEKIETLIKEEFYERLCYNAHHSVKEFTWESYIEKVVGKIDEHISLSDNFVLGD